MHLRVTQISSPFLCSISLGDHEASNACSKTRSKNNIPYLRKLLKTKPKQHMIRKSKNATKKYLAKRLRNSLPIDNLINLGDYQLTDYEIKLLNKGLSFVPTPARVKIFDIQKSFADFRRRMEIQYFFRDSNSAGKKTPFATPSAWMPPGTDNIHLINYLLSISYDLYRLSRNIIGENHNNLTKDELTAYNSLMTRKEFIIKPADKGGKVVVLHSLRTLHIFYKLSSV